MFPNISKDVAFSIVLVIQNYFFLYEEEAQPSQRVPRKRESKDLSEVLTMPTSANESSLILISISRILFFKPKPF